MGFRVLPRLGSGADIGLSVRLEKRGLACRARRLANRAGSVSFKVVVSSSAFQPNAMCDVQPQMSITP